MRSKALTTNSRAWRTSWESIIGGTSPVPTLHQHFDICRTTISCLLAVCQLQRPIASKRVYPLRLISSLQCGKPFRCSPHVTDAGYLLPFVLFNRLNPKILLPLSIRLVLHSLSSTNNYTGQREGIYGRFNVGDTVEFLRRNYNQIADPRHITMDPIAPEPISRRFGERGDCVRERQILRQCRGVRRIR